MHSATLSDVLFLILCCNKIYVSNGDAETWWSMRKPKSRLRLLDFEMPPISGQQQQTASTLTHKHIQTVSLKVVFFCRGLSKEPRDTVVFYISNPCNCGLVKSTALALQSV